MATSVTWRRVAEPRALRFELHRLDGLAPHSCLTRCWSLQPTLIAPAIPSLSASGIAMASGPLQTLRPTFTDWIAAPEQRPGRRPDRAYVLLRSGKRLNLRVHCWTCGATLNSHSDCSRPIAEKGTRAWNCRPGRAAQLFRARSPAVDAAAPALPEICSPTLLVLRCTVKILNIRRLVCSPMGRLELSLKTFVHVCLLE